MKFEQSESQPVYHNLDMKPRVEQFAFLVPFSCIKLYLKTSLISIRLY